MRLGPLTATLALGLGLFCVGLARAAVPPMPSLLPLPAQMSVRAGRFTPGPSLLVLVPPGDASARFAAETLVRLSRLAGTRIVDRVCPVGGSCIVLRIDPADPVAQPEGYSLVVTAREMRITARTEAGLFYGAVTGAQLLSDAGVPSVTIHDWPRLGWRGTMLDSARHFQTVAQVKVLIDGIAALKLNVLHWHLTDDQGWRLEIRRYPKLTAIGAWRQSPVSGPNGDGARYGGFYTQDQVRDIVAFAAARHVTIVPELDLPGHAQAAIAAYPQLGATDTAPAVSTVFGVQPYLYNVDEPTFAFLQNVLDEVMALFPSRFIHLGGDEAIKDQWRASASVQARMKELGIADEAALQSWFIERLGRYLTAHGRRLMGWDEILQGGLPASASVMSWHGVSGAVAAAEAGHDAVMTPSDRVYLDFLQSARGDEPTGGRLPAESLRTVYDFDPLPPGTSDAVRQHVLGIGAPIWTEFLTSFRMVEHAAFPRLDALAEIGWTPRARQDWAGFLSRLPDEIARQRRQGIEVADSDYAVGMNAVPDGPRIRVTLGSTLNAGTIRVTRDGRAPNPSTLPYNGAFVVSPGTVVTATPFAADGMPLAAPRSLIVDRAGLTIRKSAALGACPGGKHTSRVPALPDSPSSALLLTIDRVQDCAVYQGAVLDRPMRLLARMVPIARSFTTAAENPPAAPVQEVQAPGTLMVSQDGCAGRVLATIRLPATLKIGQPIVIQTLLAASPGVHDLCLAFSVPSSSPYMALDQVSLSVAERAGTR